MKAPLQNKAKPLSSAPPTFTPVRRGLLQRKCACGGTPGPSGEGDAGHRKRETGALQHAADHPSFLSPYPSEVPPIVHEVLRSSGQPLDPATRAFMEPRFGHDFSRVRVHTDPKAVESARAVNASAYTVGSHIAFANRQYAPDTARGKRLIAHELTHTIQQTSSTPTGSALDIGHPGDVRENEAELAASGVLSQRSPFMISKMTIGPQIIQRQEPEEGLGENAPRTMDMPASPGGEATPMTASSLPQRFAFTVPTGTRTLRNVFRSPANGNFSITASAVMSRFPQSRERYWIQPTTPWFHFNGSAEEFTTGVSSVTRSWNDLAADVDCGLEITTNNTNPTNALTGSGTINP